MAYLLKAAHAIDPQLHLDDICDVLIEDGKIAQIGKDLAAPKDARVIDAAGKYLVPGLVDMHVHFRDPGFEYKETIETGSRAAVHGGFTDVATMPNTNPVTDTGARFAISLIMGEKSVLYTSVPSELSPKNQRVRLWPRLATWSWRAPVPFQMMAMAYRVPA